MPTHYVTSSNNTLYLTDTVYYSNISGNINVTVVDEGVGTNCKYHKILVEDAGLIQYYGKQYYVLTSSVYPLSGTADSAPRICIPEGQREQTYEPEDWIKIVNIPFLDKREQKYCITVVSNYKRLDEFEKLKQDALYKGVEKIFQYYYKNSNPESITKYLSYYKFATFEQYHIPYQPNLRIKCQISIPRKYVDAIEMKEIDLTEGTLVFDTNMIGLQNKIAKVSKLLNQYHGDMIYYRFKSANVNLKKDADGLLNVISTINRYLNINKEIFFRDKGIIEFSVDNCFNILNVSYNNQVSCKYIKIGLSQMVKESPFDNPSLVNILYQLDTISKIEYCNLSWIDFLNTYYFPKQFIPQIENPLDKYTLDATRKLFSGLQIKPEQYLTKEERAAEVNRIFKINFKYSQTPSEIDFMKKSLDAYNEVFKSFRETLVIKAGSQIILADIAKFINDISSDNIIEKLQQIKICEISFQALECLATLIQIDIIDELSISLNYNQQKNDLIPSLTNEEKKILFKHILNNTAINKQSVYTLLKNYEKDTEKLNSIRSLSDDELIEFLIGYMVS